MFWEELKKKFLDHPLEFVVGACLILSVSNCTAVEIYKSWIN